MPAQNLLDLLLHRDVASAARVAFRAARTPLPFLERRAYRAVLRNIQFAGLYVAAHAARPQQPIAHAKQLLLKCCDRPVYGCRYRSDENSRMYVVELTWRQEARTSLVENFQFVNQAIDVPFQRCKLNRNGKVKRALMDSQAVPHIGVGRKLRAERSINRQEGGYWAWHFVVPSGRILGSRFEGRQANNHQVLNGLPLRLFLHAPDEDCSSHTCNTAKKSGQNRRSFCGQMPSQEGSRNGKADQDSDRKTEHKRTGKPSYPRRHAASYSLIGAAHSALRSAEISVGIVFEPAPDVLRGFRPALGLAK